MPFGRSPAWGTAGSSLISLQVELILQRAGDVNGGYELQRTDAKGAGVFATRSFHVGETVMVGVIDRELDHNHSHASQFASLRWPRTEAPGVTTWVSQESVMLVPPCRCGRRSSFTAAGAHGGAAGAGGAGAPPGSVVASSLP